MSRQCNAKWYVDEETQELRLNYVSKATRIVTNRVVCELRLSSTAAML